MALVIHMKLPKVRHVDPKEIKKKFWRRVSVFSIGMAVLVLIDEWIKEGYVFDPSDITCIGSHETLFIVFVALSLYARIKDLRGSGDGE